MRWTAIYTAVWGFWTAFFLFNRLGWVSFQSNALREGTAASGAVILCVLFFYLLSTAVSRQSPKPGWIWMGAGWLALYLLLLSIKPDVLFFLPAAFGSLLSNKVIQFSVLLAGWWPFFFGSALLALHAFKARASARQKNQIMLWWFALLASHLGLLIVFTSVLTASDPFLGFAALFPGTAVCMYAAWKTPQKTREITSRFLREYNLKISKILDPDRLALEVVGLTSNALDARDGMFFVVRKKTILQGEMQYHLKGKTGVGQEDLPLQILAGSSPAANYFKRENRPISWLEMEQYLRRPGVQQEDLDWLQSFSGKILIPIAIKGEWLGLLVLGSKRSDEPYDQEDLDILGILADQTGIAMQNARLVENLTRVNEDLKRAYFELEKANQHLERLDKTKSDFISICSHELRTPISIIRGYTEILRDQTEIKENPYPARLISGIQAGVGRLHEIVDSMLDMASIDTRSLELHTGPSSLTVIIRLAAESFKKTLKERRLTLRIEDLRGLPELEADSEALLKVFTHLIANAIKFTPDGGQITISGNADPDHQYVEIIVRDSGIGIEQDLQELIFKKFYQTGKLELHSSGKTKFKGAGPGLGLAITKGIVEAHGGKIWAESAGYDEENCPGSAFHVVLPTRG